MRRYIPTFEAFWADNDDSIDGNPYWADKNDMNVSKSAVDESIFNNVMDAYFMVGSDASMHDLNPRMKRKIDSVKWDDVKTNVMMRTSLTKTSEKIRMYAIHLLERCGNDVPCAQLAQTIAYRADEIKPNEGFFALAILEEMLAGNLEDHVIDNPIELKNWVISQGIVSKPADYRSN